MERLNGEQRQELKTRSLRVLERNDWGTYIAPRKGHYDDAWLWDIYYQNKGLRHYDLGKAASNLLFISEQQQWRNGMLGNTRYVGNTLNSRLSALMWNARLLNPNAPRNAVTSGITQPPVVAEGTFDIVELMNDRDDRRDYEQRMLPVLTKYHEWLYRERSYGDDGLISVVHPWESGQDNNQAMMAYARGLEWGTAVSGFSKVVKLLRNDGHLPREQRASDEESELMTRAHLSLIGCRYDADRLRDNHPFWYIDPGMNSLLMRNNEYLQELADDMGVQLPDELVANIALTRANFGTLWDSRDELFYPRDARTGQAVRVETLSSYLPLEAGVVAPGGNDTLVARMTDPDKYFTPYGQVNVALDSQLPDNYWGKIWQLTNYRTIDALMRAGRPDLAAEVRENSLRGVYSTDSHEYWTHKGEGQGVSKFSWTAALSLAMLYDAEH